MRDEKAWKWLNESELGYDIWEKKYRYNNESFDGWLDRVSGRNEELRKLIEEQKFLFGGRALANRGTNKKGSMFNCYSSGFCGDDINEIMQLNTNLALTYKAQGGQGVSMSKVRPKGTPIGGEFMSDGIVPFMEIFNTTTASISQGGARKGALMISLDIMHKEAETFITIKSNEDKITKANLSLEIDDEFMTAVQEYYINGKTVVLHQKREYGGHIVEYDVTPINLYKLMVQTVYDWAEPGCIFTERFRNYNLMEFDPNYKIETCNPCGEQPLPKNFSCNLGSINVSEFVVEPYTSWASFNFEEFRNAVRVAVDALDTIIDENLDRHALKEQKDNSFNYRNIGLGIFGYSNALFKLKLKYGSEQAIEFTKLLFSEMMKAALRESVELAIDKGSFPMCNKEAILKSEIFNKIAENSPGLRDDIARYGLRNCSLLSIAPNGSTATLLGLSGGCEPEFALSYKRKTDNLKESYDVYCSSVNDYWNALNIPEEERNIENLPDYFVTSKDIKWQDRVNTQAAMQEFVDTAISSTVNLPHDIPIEEVEQIYLYAWSRGLKGITIYRAGCKREGILVEDKPAVKEVFDDAESVDTSLSELPRGYVVDVSDDLIGYKRKLNTGCGSLHLEVYSDELTGEPQETFINIGSSGGCERNYQFISRLISTALRGGIPIEAIVDQAKSIRPCNAYVSRTKSKHDTSPGTSCPSAIGLALQDLYDKTKGLYVPDEILEEECDACESSCCSCKREDLEHTDTTNHTDISELIDNMICPECGARLQSSGGCVICMGDDKTPGCGWSKCD